MTLTTDSSLKLWQLIHQRKQATTNEERDRLDRLIEARIRWVGSGQGDAQ